jgi:hypothetical protein
MHTPHSIILCLPHTPHYTFTSMGTLIYIKSITPLHEPIMNRSHSYTTYSLKSVHACTFYFYLKNLHACICLGNYLALFQHGGVSSIYSKGLLPLSQGVNMSTLRELNLDEEDNKHATHHPNYEPKTIL